MNSNNGGKKCYCNRGDRKCQKRIKNGHCQNAQCALGALQTVNSREMREVVSVRVSK